MILIKTENWDKNVKENNWLFLFIYIYYASTNYNDKEKISAVLRLEKINLYKVLC